jgi:hypothetical protein
MDIKKELSSNQTILIIMPSEKYNDELTKIAKKLSSESVCYVTLNKTYDSLQELFKKKKINMENMFFIDAITKTIKKSPDQTEKCFYCSSPGALTEISLAISKFLKHNFNYLIFDSLTNLSIYQKKAPVSKFVSNLTNKIKQTKTQSVFYALSVKEEDTLIKESGMFVDKIINLN